MVAKIKNSFLKNSFQLFCYRNLKDNNKFDEDLKRLSTSFPNLYNGDKPEIRKSKSVTHDKRDKISRSQSANGRYCDENETNKTKTEPVKTHQSIKTLKQLKKKNELVITSDSEKVENVKNRSKSSLPRTERDNENFKTKIIRDSKPSENKNGALSSLKFSKRLQSFKKQNKTQPDVDPCQSKSNLSTTSSILNQKRRYLTSASEKKAVRFADSLGLELESVICLNNQLDANNQIKSIHLARNSMTSTYNYTPIFYTDKNMNQNYINLNYSEYIDSKGNPKTDVLKMYEHVNESNSLNGASFLDFNNSKIEDRYLNRQNQIKVLNYADPKLYTSNYYKIYDESQNYSSPNYDSVKNNANLYYAYANGNLDQNYKKISITTRLNNGKLESEV